MRALVTAGRTLLGLFVDDGWSAVAIGALLAGLLALKANEWIEGPELQAALVAGTIVILLESVARAARTDNRS